MNNKRMAQKKDKPFMKRPMRDVIGDDTPIFDDSANSGDTVNDTVDVFDFNEDFNNELVNYNENIHNYDPEFTKINVYHKILVRMYVKPLQRNSQGLLMPSEQMVNVPTKSGYGNLMALRNPWPFDTRAVIIAVPSWAKDSNEYPIGSEVLLSGAVTEGRIIGNGDQGVVNLPYQFLHPDIVEGNHMPLNPSHRGYGYMLIDPRMIEVRL